MPTQALRPLPLRPQLCAGGQTLTTRKSCATKRVLVLALDTTRLPDIERHGKPAVSYMNEQHAGAKSVNA